MSLGRVHGGNQGEDFCMTVLALKNARRSNAVSSLHGDVSRSMWQPLYPGRAEEEVPIDHITNGIHVPSWVAPQMRQLFDRHLGPDWIRNSSDPALWDKIGPIDNGELWETHQVLKAALLGFRPRTGHAAGGTARRAADHRPAARPGAQPRRPDDRLRAAFRHLQAGQPAVPGPRADQRADQRPAIARAGGLRRQGPPARRARQAGAPRDRPLRPRSAVLRARSCSSRTTTSTSAEYLVQGVDVWLNNPRRPLEASGTSGMKVVLNGGLNLSVLDGWWAEAYDGSNGFAIGAGESHVLTEMHDRIDGQALHRVLKEQVIPLYYQRDHDGLPLAWIARMKAAIRTLGWRFSANRMVRDYVTNCYIPAAGGTSSDCRHS